MMATLRPFDWRDLPTLHRYRDQGLCLDTVLAVTRGPSLTTGVLLSSLTPATGIFTWVYKSKKAPLALMGQIAHASDAPFARITFLAPENGLASPGTAHLLEHLAQKTQQQGLLNLLAESDEKSVAFESLRQAGFAIYARQRIWQKEANAPHAKPEIPWGLASKPDVWPVQSLYHNVVPGLVQQIEPLPEKQINGLVCYHEGELIGYADLQYGPRGVWVQPFIHPDAPRPEARLRDLFISLTDPRTRPIFIGVRTYQSWLEGALEVAQARPGPAQAVMVKRLVAQQRVTRPFALPQIEGSREVTTPVAQSKRNGSSVPNLTNH